MSAVSVTLVPEEVRSTPDDELLVEVGSQSLALSRPDAKKLRDALCIMVGMPGKKK